MTNDEYSEWLERKRQAERENRERIARRDKPMQDAIAKAAAEVRAIRGKR